MSEGGVPKREALRKLKVVQLRHQLSEAGLAQNGLKEVLITRLLNYYKEQAEQAKETQAESSPEPTGEEEEEHGGPATEEGGDMDVSMEGGEREEGGKEGDSVSSLPTEQQEEREEVPKEKDSVPVEEGTGNEEMPEETAMEEDPVVTDKQDGTTTETTSLPPVPAHPEVAEVEPQTGQREPPGTELLGSRDQTADTESAPHVTEDPADPVPTHDDDKVPEVSAESDDPEPIKPQPVLEEESTRESEPQGEQVSAMARDSGLEELDNEPLVPSSNLAEQPPPPPSSTSSDYFSDSTREDEPLRSQTEIRVTPTATPPPSSQVTPPAFQSSNGPHTFAPPSLESIPLPPQAPPLQAPPPQAPPAQQREPEAKEWRQPAVPSEPKTSAESEPKGKRKKKKRRRRRHRQSEGTASNTEMEESKDEPEVEIEYVQEDILQPGDPNYRQFHKIFEMFKISEPEKKVEPHDSALDLVAKAVEASKKMAAAIAVEKRRESSSDEEEEEAEANKEIPKISKKKLRKLNRLSVAQLKQLVERPDVVEMHDVTAQDPRLLVQLKSIDRAFSKEQ